MLFTNDLLLILILTLIPILLLVLRLRPGDPLVGRRHGPVVPSRDEVCRDVLEPASHRPRDAALAQRVPFRVAVAAVCQECYKRRRCRRVEYDVVGFGERQGAA